jgi:hypothetical protein
MSNKRKKHKRVHSVHPGQTSATKAKTALAAVAKAPEAPAPSGVMMRLDVIHPAKATEADQTAEHESPGWWQKLRNRLRRR